MISPALIKFVVSKWNDVEDETAVALQEIAGNLHGTTVVDEDTQLPFACTFTNIIPTEVHSGDSYLELYNLKILFYGSQNAGEHHSVGKLINKLLLEKCQQYHIDTDSRILHIIPSSNYFEIVEKELLVGRDLLVSEFNYKVLIQTNLS